MQQTESLRQNPYEGQRTDLGPVHRPAYPVDLDIDLKSHDVYAQGTPHDALRRLRRSAPVFWHPEHEAHEPGFWVLTRHSDIMAVSKEPSLYSSAIGAGALMSFEKDGWDIPQEALAIRRATLVHMDPPEHRDYRGAIMPYLGGPAAKRLEAVIRETVDTLIDSITPGEAFDLVKQFSAVTPAVTLCHLLGVPEQDRQQIVAWGDTLAGVGDPEYAAAAAGVQQQLFRYGWDLLEQKKQKPGDDLLSAAIKEYSTQGGRLPPGSMEGLFTLMVVAGHRTTRNTTTCGLLELYQRPDQVRLLRDDPGLIKNAVEEILRFTTVVPVFRRTCTADTEIHGQKIAQGEKIVLCYSAANRDEDVFADPDDFDIRRPNAKQQLAFGWGTHMCAGNMLARLQLRIAVEAFVSRFGSLEVVEPPVYLRTNQAVSPKSVIVRVL